jgi:hypothetical protein
VRKFSQTKFPTASPIKAPRTQSPTKAPTKYPTKASPTKPSTQSFTPAVFTKTIPFLDGYLEGCEVFLDGGGTGHWSDGYDGIRADFMDTVGQDEFVFPQGDAKYTNELKTCVESFIFDAALANQPQGAILIYPQPQT